MPSYNWLGTEVLSLSFVFAKSWQEFDLFKQRHHAQRRPPFFPVVFYTEQSQKLNERPAWCVVLDLMETFKCNVVHTLCVRQCFFKSGVNMVLTSFTIPGMWGSFVLWWEGKVLAELASSPQFADFSNWLLTAASFWVYWFDIVNELHNTCTKCYTAVHYYCTWSDSAWCEEHMCEKVRHIWLLSVTTPWNYY